MAVIAFAAILARGHGLFGLRPPDLRKRSTGYGHAASSAVGEGMSVIAAVDGDILGTGGKVMGGRPWGVLFRAINPALVKQGLGSAWRGVLGLPDGAKEALGAVFRGLKDTVLEAGRRVKECLGAMFRRLKGDGRQHAAAMVSDPAESAPEAPPESPPESTLGGRHLLTVSTRQDEAVAIDWKVRQAR